MEELPHVVESGVWQRAFVPVPFPREVGVQEPELTPFSPLHFYLDPALVPRTLISSSLWALPTPFRSPPSSLLPCPSILSGVGLSTYGPRRYVARGAGSMSLERYGVPRAASGRGRCPCVFGHSSRNSVGLGLVMSTETGQILWDPV